MSSAAMAGLGIVGANGAERVRRNWEGACWNVGARSEETRRPAVDFGDKVAPSSDTAPDGSSNYMKADA